MSINRLLSLPVIVIAISVLVFFILAARVMSGTPLVFDLAVLNWFAEHSSSMATGVFRLITWAGSIFFLAPLGLVISYILAVRNCKADAVYFISSFTIAAIAARLLKYLIAVERPDVHPALVETFSVNTFPSVHAAQITVFCLALYMVLTRLRHGLRALAGVIFIALCLGVMCSRLYLQVHYPGDVIGGALLGIVCALGCFMLLGKQSN